MKKINMRILIIALAVMTVAGCASMNKTQKGAATGTVAGGAAGAVIGRATGNTALGAIIGAAVGGTTGAIIGSQMDKQAEEIKKTVPDAQVVRVGEGIVIEFSSNVLFGFDKSGLSAEAKNNLDKLIKVIESYPDTDIEVQGHTDSRGSVAYNQNLSEERAYEVTSYLVSKGVDTSRLTINGFGESLPKYVNTTDEGRAQNRRVEFLVTANEKMREEAEKQASK